MQYEEEHQNNIEKIQDLVDTYKKNIESTQNKIDTTKKETEKIKSERKIEQKNLATLEKNLEDKMEQNEARAREFKILAKLFYMFEKDPKNLDKSQNMSSNLHTSIEE
mmetsp:Transcript_32250/g.23801  ORF Transcript_32250/g.23801 Transcript_32250/m.23801 type:complete len:108 (+) Transcript_32250:603-926(+)